MPFQKGNTVKSLTGELGNHSPQFSIKLLPENFAELDRIAIKRDMKRGALARHYILEGMKREKNATADAEK